MLTTIATHRESHVVAHAALARLGEVFTELVESPDSLLDLDAEIISETSTAA